MNTEQRADLLAMLASESYFEKPFTLTSGRSSNYYIDCKRTLYLPRGAFLAGELMLELVRAVGVEQVGGMAAGALPLTDAILAAAWRHSFDLTGFFVRKESRTHGMRQQIEGVFKKGARTAVVDDTITTGGSSLQAAAAARRAGALVTAVVAMVDRDEGAAEVFARAGLEYRWLFSAEEIRARRATLGGRG